MCCTFQYRTPPALAAWCFNFNLRAPDTATSDTTGFSRVVLQLQPMMQARRFNFNLPARILEPMTSRPPFSHLESAYQLHFYLCFKTHYLREALVGDTEQQLVNTTAEAVCAKEGYLLLETRVEPAHVRLLLSLKPDQSISQAVQRLKGTISRRFSATFATRLPELRMPTLWARGYFARSAGKVSLDNVRSYVDSQIAHHGYRGAWTEGLR